MNVDLIGPYSKSTKQQKKGGSIINNNISLTCMTMIDPATGWFEIIEVQTYDIDEVMGGNDEYTDKSSTRVSQLFNNTDLSIHLRPRKVVFDNGSKFK